ncbi:hypothetical protein PG994_000697 [Apiospora phragmitis]|uniref:Uncharacterized protein n=1 Tax=Apiospora phragmitis TaxID=2905665 RepID=A0ABR1X754_9PEZI
MSRFTLTILAVFAMVYAVAASPFPVFNGTQTYQNITYSPITNYNATIPGNSTNATALVRPIVRRNMRNFPVSLPLPN